MGLCISPDIFQENMNELLNGLEYVRAYINLVMGTQKRKNTVKIVLHKLNVTCFKINAKKKFLLYLGFKITRQSKMSLHDKVQAIKDTAVPTNEN